MGHQYTSRFAIHYIFRIYLRSISTYKQPWNSLYTLNQDNMKINTNTSQDFGFTQTKNPQNAHFHFFGGSDVWHLMHLVRIQATHNRTIGNRCFTGKSAVCFRINWQTKACQPSYIDRHTLGELWCQSMYMYIYTFYIESICISGDIFQQRQ